MYGSASDADLLAGKWYTIGTQPDFRQCECPSVYPLPAATPGTEDAYAAAARAGALPTTVHKTSCGGDWWQLGTYEAGPAKTLGSFQATPGWEDTFAQKRMDQGKFYASKDNSYPTRGSTASRRVNWGRMSFKEFEDGPYKGTRMDVLFRDEDETNFDRDARLQKAHRDGHGEQTRRRQSTPGHRAGSR